MIHNDDQSEAYLKGRGAQINTANRFDKYIGEEDPSVFLDEDEHQIPTEYIQVKAKTIINKIESPDIPMPYSMNPYQGCEHGCIYCYARNTHNYWGYSAGLDFEQKILIKHDAPELLAQKFKSKNWKAAPIMLSGNTDCYQPIERKLEITRKLLEVCWRYRHPVGIITKNSMVLRDLDILQKLQKENLVSVAISLTTLNEELRQYMEPRTATVAGRLKTIEQLAAHDIPVTLMMAPIIPGLTDHEIFQLLEKAAAAGASRAAYTMVRLNGDIATLFEDWLRKNYPDRADKVINKIKECHGGKMEDNRFGKRMSGEGKIAEIISKQFRLARKKYFPQKEHVPLNTDLYYRMKAPQMRLF